MDQVDGLVLVGHVRVRHALSSYGERQRITAAPEMQQLRSDASVPEKIQFCAYNHVTKEHGAGHDRTEFGLGSALHMGRSMTCLPI